MRVFASLLVMHFATIAAAAPVPIPTPREAESLIEKLGHEEYVVREAASRRLEAFGVLALAPLRIAAKSDNPEIAERAKNLLPKIEFRIASDHLLTPTLVEINVKEARLDNVLAALSKQAGCEVVLGGIKREEMAAKKITVAAEGKVPFWTAVLKVCDAGDLRLVVVPKQDDVVMLEPRNSTKKRPMSVYGAVLIESLETPRAATPNALLQIWPEPKLSWKSVSRVKVARAISGEGRLLTPEYVLARPLQIPNWKPLPIVITADGSSAFDGPFNSNSRQSEVRFKGNGDWQPSREFIGSVLGTVRTVPEALATLQLNPNRQVAVKGQAGVEMKASLRIDKDGKTFVDVVLSFEPTALEAVQLKDKLPEVKLLAADGNQSLLGVRVTDTDDAAFALLLNRQGVRFINNRISADLSFEVLIKKDGATTPAKVTFWGRVLKPVDVPFAFKDLPLK